uniref:Prolactin releasing hormone n=1 Tax=Astyanax mexicanus TaxID=7994 RepID=A0A8B9J3M1_ASTMX
MTRRLTNAVVTCLLNIRKVYDNKVYYIKYIYIYIFVHLNKLLLKLLTFSDRKIDALWYKGRGIRPVGRFGRRIVKTTRGVYYGQQSICSSCRDPDATRD